MSDPQRGGLIAVASHLWSSPVHAATAELLDPRPGEAVVDLGAGFGATTLHLARRLSPAGRVVAIDPSRLMRLAIRARQAIHPARDLIDVRSGTAEQLPLPDRSVDAAVAMNVIHLLRNVDAAAAELTRVLRPGGRYLFVEEDLDDPAHRFHDAEPHAPNGPSANELTRALERAGSTAKTDRRRLGTQPVTILTTHPAG